MTKFRLQRVLEIRELLEIEKQKKFSLVLNRLLDKEKKLTDMQEKKHNFAGQMNLVHKITANEVAGHHDYLSTLAGTIENIRGEILAIKKEVEAKRQELLNASRQRKMIEKLKEKHEEEHKLLLIRNEQTFIDEIARRKGTLSD